MTAQKYRDTRNDVFAVKYDGSKYSVKEITKLVGIPRVVFQKNMLTVCGAPVEVGFYIARNGAQIGIIKKDIFEAVYKPLRGAWLEDFFKREPAPVEVKSESPSPRTG